MDKIAAGLERDGILTGAGGKRWHTSTINKILRNEKYIGDALLQKTYTTDFLSKTRVKNNGIVPSIMWKEITRQSFPETSSCEYRRSWCEGGWSIPAPTEKSAATAATTASPKSSSAVNTVKCSEGSTGTTEESSPLSGVASAGWSPQVWNATLEPSMSWFFKMSLSKPSIK